MGKRYADMTEEQKKMARARNLKWRKTHPEKSRTGSRDAGRKWRKANPEKMRAYSRNWGQINFERVRKRVGEWQKANPEKVRAKSRRHRALKNGQTEHYNDLEWKLLCEQYEYRCLKCGKQNKLTPDHVMPLALGGKDTIDNIQPLCLSCNSSKGATYIDYRNYETIRVEQLSFLGMAT